MTVLGTWEWGRVSRGNEPRERALRKRGFGLPTTLPRPHFSSLHPRFTLALHCFCAYSSTHTHYKMKVADERKRTMEDCNKEGFFHLSTRQNSDHKWRTSPAIIGCLEVPSEPTLSFQANYVRRPVTLHATDFGQALHVWHELKLRQEFMAACAGTASVHTCCFGLVSNDDATIRQLVPDLNRGWVRATNRRLQRLGHAFFIDCFVWNWQNALGKSETNILLIRFHKVVPSASFSTLSSSSITTVGGLESGDNGEHKPSVSGP
jgi:hypothetical protein